MTGSHIIGDFVGWLVRQSVCLQNILKNSPSKILTHFLTLMAVGGGKVGGGGGGRGRGGGVGGGEG